jgi:hypothetical protein
MASPASAVMPSPSVRFVHSRAVRYQPCVVDLRWRRSVHSCDICAFRTGTVAATASLFGSTNVRRWSSSSTIEDENGSTKSCTAVHYGVCTPVRPGTVPPPRHQQDVVQVSSPSVPSPVTSAPAGFNGSGGSTPQIVAASVDRPESPPPPPLPEKRRVNVPAAFLQVSSMNHMISWIC